MKANHIFAGQLFYGLFSAGTGKGLSVCMSVTEEHRRKRTQRHLQRSYFLVRDGGELELLLAQEIGLRKNGIENHVGGEIERFVESGRERGKKNRRSIEIATAV